MIRNEFQRSINKTLVLDINDLMALDLGMVVSQLVRGVFRFLNKNVY